MNKKISIAVAVVVVVLVGIIIIINNQKSSPLERKTVTIASPRIISALLPVAVEKKFFDKYGIDVKLLPTQTGDEAVKAVVGKSADIALVGTIPYSFLAIDKPEMKIFVTIAEGRDMQMVSRKDRGISKPADLKGKRVGYTKTSTSESGLEKFLEMNGLQKGDIQWINLKPLAMSTALLSGDIDAYFVWEPLVSTGVKTLGDKVIVFDTPDYSWLAGLVANETYITSNKDTLEKLVKALIETDKFVSENKEEAIAITANFVNIPAETLNNIWPKFKFKVDLQNDLADILRVSLLWANDRREFKSEKLPDPKNLIDNSIFEYAKNH